ncbi:MAG: cytochrome c [Deltaproteobacteria bacterium]|nr:cytochrome c [Deltaproteobacteria bacterium]
MKIMCALLSIFIIMAFCNLCFSPHLNGAQVINQGQEAYEANCADCHRSNGEGLAVKFPALKGNPFVTGAPQPLIELMLRGRKGKMGLMPAWQEHLSDAQMAALLSYIRNAWGNQAAPVQPQDVGKLRRY